MTRFFIGTVDGEPLLRVTVDPDVPPWEVDPDDFANIRFDSNREAMGYVVETIQTEIDFTGFIDPMPNNSITYTEFWPPGTNASDCLVHLQMSRGTGSLYRWQAYLKLDNIVPEWQDRFVFMAEATTSWRYRWTRSGNPVQIWIDPHARFVMLPAIYGPAGSPDPLPIAGIGCKGFRDSSFYHSGSYWNQFENGRPTTLPGINFFVTDLPTGDEDYPETGPAPTQGEPVIRLTPTSMRMARRGYTIADDDDKMIFCDTRIPLKVAAAGTATIAASGTHVVTPVVAIDENCLVEFYATQTGQVMTVPPFQGVLNQTNLVAWRVNGGDVEFRNDSSISIDIVYVVFAEGIEPQSVGSAPEVEVGADGRVIMRAPGTAGTSLRDVILDTALPFVPIAAQGWVPHGSFVTSDVGVNGTHMVDVALDNDGSWTPLLIWALTCQRRASPFDIQMRWPNINYLTATSPNRLSALSVFARLEPDRVRMYAWRGTANFTYAQTSPIYFEYDPYDCIGIRYYILAVPNSLEAP
jgi:hypothetical protein